LPKQIKARIANLEEGDRKHLNLPKKVGNPVNPTFAKQILIFSIDIPKYHTADFKPDRYC